MSPAMVKPTLMGCMMGAMGLWMFHGWLTGEGPANVVAFALAHVAVLGVLALLLALGFHTRFPALKRMTHHRPSWSHIGVMLGAALLTAGVIHSIHGAPTWI